MKRKVHYRTGVGIVRDPKYEIMRTYAQGAISLADALRRMGHSISDVAALLGVSYRTARRLVICDSVPDLMQLARLNAVWGLDVGLLISGWLTARRRRYGDRH